MKEQKLNKKLAEWAGFTYCDGSRGSGSHSWTDPNGMPHFTELINITNFTESLDACFKWLVPKAVTLIISNPVWGLSIEQRLAATEILFREWLRQMADAGENKEALALCLAIEKLIDNESHSNTTT